MTTIPATPLPGTPDPADPPGPTVRAAADRRSAGPLRQFVRRLLRNRTAVVALVFLVLLIMSVAAAPLLAPYDPLAQNLRATMQPPTGEHWLGTDELGRDVLSRLLFAGRVSLLAAAQAVLVGVVLGVPFGLLAGYRGGRVDMVIMRVTDALLSFPPLILAITIVGIRGRGLTNAMIAVGIVFAPRLIRLVRSTVRSVCQETFVEASHSIGTPGWRIVSSHVLPNVLPPLIVQISLAASFAMLAEAGLSFLGLGVQSPEASWGSILGRSFSSINTAAWLSILPGLCIAVTVLALNVLGDGMRDAIGKEDRSR